MPRAHPDDSNRATVRFITSAAMPNLIYRACVKTGVVSNTVYCQHALAEAIARDLEMPIDVLLAALPAPRGPAGHLYDKSFYKFMLYQELPHLRHIVYANTGELLTGVFERPPRRSWAGRVARASLPFLPALRRRAATVYHYFRPAPMAASAYSLFRYLAQDVKLMNIVRDTVTGSAPARTLLDTEAALGFVAEHTERLRGEKPTADDGAGVPGVGRGVPALAAPAATDE